MSLELKKGCALIWSLRERSPAPRSSPISSLVATDLSTCATWRREKVKESHGHREMPIEIVGDMWRSAEVRAPRRRVAWPGRA